MTWKTKKTTWGFSYDKNMANFEATLSWAQTSYFWRVYAVNRSTRLFLKTREKKSAYIISVCKLSSNFASNVKVTSKGFHVVKTGVQGLWWVDEEIIRITHFEPVFHKKNLYKSYIFPTKKLFQDIFSTYEEESLNWGDSAFLTKCIRDSPANFPS